jgi:hypothetical protein
MSEDPGKCPHCGGESDGTILYSLPPQARCVACKKTWRFGEGLQTATEEEAKRVRPEFDSDKAMEKTCIYCGRTAEGNYSIHKYSMGEGPEVDLCDADGQDLSPTCEEIWARIREVERMSVCPDPNPQDGRRIKDRDG